MHALPIGSFTEQIFTELLEVVLNYEEQKSMCADDKDMIFKCM